MRTAIVGVVLGLAVLIDGIRVAPRSPCSSFCGNVLQSTLSSDIVCPENEYVGSKGQVFSGCINCELTSNYVYAADGETDQQWLLYNARYATSYCLFGVPDGQVESNPCLTSRACQPLQDAITYMNLAGNTSAYEYCKSWSSAAVAGCESCLRAGSRNIISNLITVLDAGCQQRPADGERISIEGKIFSSTDFVKITKPMPSLESAYDTTAGFPIGAKVGIAMAAVLVLLAGIGCCIIHTGKRRRRAYLRRVETQKPHNMPAVAFAHAHGSPRAAPMPVITSWPSPSLTGLGFGLTPSPGHDLYSETPLSQRPLRGTWDDSPLSASTDRSPMAMQPSVRYWSPYGSPVSPDDGRAQFAQFSKHKDEKITPVQPREIGLAFGDTNTPAVSSKKGKEREAAEEAYEMYKFGHSEVPSSIPPPPQVLPPPVARDRDRGQRQASHGESGPGHGQHGEDASHQRRYAD